MNTFLTLCELCVDALGWFLTILLFLLCLPIIFAFAIVAIPVFIVVGIISKLLGLTEDPKVG